MEIFNVNRQAYQHLGVMTWASLPDMNTVPAGTRVTIIGWMAPPSDWVWDGAYLLPVGGRAVVHAPMLADAQAQSGTFATVASVPGWLTPPALSRTPGAYIEACVYCTAVNSSSAQARTLSVGVASGTRTIVYDNSFANAGIADIRMIGRSHRRYSGQWCRLITAADLATTSAFSAVDQSILDVNPWQLFYQGGNPDGSEILTVHAFSLTFGVG